MTFLLQLSNFLLRRLSSEDGVISEQQAVPADYEGHTRYMLAQLNPFMYHSTDSALFTFTLANVVPFELLSGPAAPQTESRGSAPAYLIQVYINKPCTRHVKLSLWKDASTQLKIEISFIIVMYRRKMLNFTSNRKIKNKITSHLSNLCNRGALVHDNSSLSLVYRHTCTHTLPLCLPLSPSLSRSLSRHFKMLKNVFLSGRYVILHLRVAVLLSWVAADIKTILLSGFGAFLSSE